MEKSGLLGYPSKEAPKDVGKSCIVKKGWGTQKKRANKKT